MSQRILIACIGNIFLGDDAFGFEVSRALATAQLPPSAKVIDFGIRGLDLAYTMLDEWQAIILVDAVHCGGSPGTLYLLQPADAIAEESGIDPHAMDPERVIATARSLGQVNAEIYIVGCEPEDFGDPLDGRMGLSNTVAAAIPEAVKMVADLAEHLCGENLPACAAT